MDDDRPIGTVLPMPAAPDAIELRHLRAFVAVAEDLNFSRAAARLYVSQPALSRQIRSLEQLVGCELLQRSTHRVDLTVAGDALLDRARQVLADVDGAILATRAIGGELDSRVSELWAPIVDLVSTSPDLQALRDATEQLNAQFEPVAGIHVRSINAAGVPSLLLSPESGQSATVLHLHGGGYVMGSAFGSRHVASALAASSGAGVLVPDYRLAPEYPFPAAVEDAVRAYLWMVDSGAEPESVVVTGDSAGGALALSLLTTLKRQSLPLLGGTALMCPAGINLHFDDHDDLSSSPQPILTIELLQMFAKAYLGSTSPDDAVVNALEADISGFPPMLIHAGSGDTLGGDAHRLADHARRHGVDVKFELYPVNTHDFHVFWSFLPEAADAMDNIGQFIQRIQQARGEGKPFPPWTPQPVGAEDRPTKLGRSSAL